MLYLIFLILFFIAFAFFCWSNVRRGIYAICLLLPTYLVRFTIGGIPLTLLEGMIIILFIIWLIKIYQDQSLDLAITGQIRKLFHWRNWSENMVVINLIPPVIRWPLVIFLAASFVAFLWSPNQFAAAGIWKAYFLEAVVFFVLVIYNIKNHQQLNWVVNNLAILAIVIFIYALIQKLTGWQIPNPEWANPFDRRVTTFFGYPNANGLLLGPLSVIFLATSFLSQNIFSRLLKITAVVASLSTIVWAQSEGALVASCLVMLVILLVQKRTRKRVIILVIILLALSLTQIDQLPIIKQKILLQDLSGQIRQQQWTETTQMLEKNILLGGGLANYQAAISPYHQRGMNIDGQWQPVEIYLYPHNIILNFWTEIGLIGLLAFLAMIIGAGLLIYRAILIIKKTNLEQRRQYEQYLLAGAGALAVIFIHGLVDVHYFKNDLSILFWLVMGLIVINYNLLSSKEA
ncbi:MAG: hypothetical protein COX77_00875 [Candidatus Komeilibacteria bacterium CG_4_10_14_0_2_um_filter_37_10]|uniref:O-antigen ligase-related domain-containing protein n=1 Tax=Candidatus Komeilibacteria bacterium CG_4_10_14_0_2_um_filter_37_10 TaxID=1974470 RepID=A0A2M7VG57_9BACT|nr:MAG: hypothetical protein COX77_00875 [Candidatus Komeilibacteria bacterium CG_4_10_14_0_2_um_filter_37_10]